MPIEQKEYYVKAADVLDALSRTNVALYQKVDYSDLMVIAHDMKDEQNLIHYCKFMNRVCKRLYSTKLGGYAIDWYKTIEQLKFYLRDKKLLKESV